MIDGTKTTTRLKLFVRCRSSLIRTEPNLTSARLQDARAARGRPVAVAAETAQMGPNSSHRDRRRSKRLEPSGCQVSNCSGGAERETTNTCSGRHQFGPRRACCLRRSRRWHRNGNKRPTTTTKWANFSESFKSRAFLVSNCAAPDTNGTLIIAATRLDSTPILSADALSSRVHAYIVVAPK